jgi:hypothetical protein
MQPNEGGKYLYLGQRYHCVMYYSTEKIADAAREPGDVFRLVKRPPSDSKGEEYVRSLFNGYDSGYNETAQSFLLGSTLVELSDFLREYRYESE